MKTITAGGDKMKTCRGCPFLLKLGNGKDSILCCKHENHKLDGTIKTAEGKVEFLTNKKVAKIPVWCPIGKYLDIKAG